LGSITEAFKTLFNQKSFSDVTIAFDDQTQFSAHKVILSALSPVFNQLLLANSHPHPLLYMSGVHHQDMKSLLQFMYLGEVTIFQDRMPSFMEAAKKFRLATFFESNTEDIGKDMEDKDIKEYGVADDLEDEADSEEEVGDTVPSDNSKTYEDKSSSKSFPSGNIVDANIDDGDALTSCTDCRLDSTEHKKNCLREYDYKVVGSQFSCKRCEYNTTIKMNMKRHHQTKHDNIQYGCTQCEFTSKRADHLKIHEKSKHLGITYKCKECEHEAPTKVLLRYHNKTKHSGILYSYMCEDCDFQTDVKKSLRRHVRFIHEGFRFSCEKCEYSSSTRESINNHKYKMHIKTENLETVDA